MDAELRLHMAGDEDAGRRAERTVGQYISLLEAAAGRKLDVSTRWRMHCDGCGCDNEKTFESFDDARKSAHDDDGWTTVGTEDFCRECSTDTVGA